MVCLTVTTDIHGADNSRSKRVLIVSTGSNFAPGFTHAAETAADTLRQLESGPLELYSESLDIVRFTSDSYSRLFRNYLGEKYIDYPLDLILLIYVGNLGLAEKLLKELFPGVPIVAFGLTEEKIVPAQLGTHLIGLAQRSDPRGTLESIFRLQPEIRRIVVIGGTAEVDTHVVSRVREAARSLSGRAEFDFWTNRPMSEITQAVRSLPTQTVILFTRMYRDGAGQAFNSAQAVKSIIESANAPMYVMADTLLGSGAVGGSVADVMALARRAGQLAHDILSGVAPESLPFEIRTDGVPMFDWPALKRWGISEARLPPDSIIRNRPRSVWDQYRWYIIGALIIMTMQATMIVDLLMQRARRRRAESKQRETQEIMELAASAGELGLWMRDPKGGDFWANPQFRSLLGPDTNNALRFEDVVKRIHPDDRARMAAEVERAEQIGLPYEGEFRVVLLDGRERWIATRGRNVNDPRGRGARRMGVVLDITERKKAEERLRESEENFRRLVESTAAVIWEADIETWQFTYVGPQAVKLLGYPLEQWYERDFWVSHIHPDDRARAIDTCLTMSQAAEEFEFNYRMIKASGDIVWVHDIVNCQHHDSKPKHFAVSCSTSPSEKIVSRRYGRAKSAFALWPTWRR
jgi:PAS domain S-box-containing protein